MAKISRRAMIKLSGSGLLALASLPILRHADSPTDDSVDWSNFLELCHELSQAQFDEDWNQDNYTKEIEKVLQRLDVSSEHIQKRIAVYSNRNPYFPEIRDIHRETQFQVSLIEFEPDEDIPLHDHPDMTGVILCTEGKVDVEHYDKLEETSADDLPLLQKERAMTMKPGDSAILTATKGNIHSLHAVEFTRMIDVFTPPYNRDRSSRARYYKLADRSYQQRLDVFEAQSSRSPRFP